MVLQMTSLGVNSTAVQHRECPLDVGQEVAVRSSGNHRHLTRFAESRQSLGQLQLMAGIRTTEQLNDRRGGGVALLRAALDAPECSEHPVRIEVWEHNHAARRLYERFGFHDEGERAPFLLKSGEIDGYDVVLVRRPAAT